MQQSKNKTLSEIIYQYKDQKPKKFGHDDLTERCYPISAILDIVKEYSDQKVTNLEAQSTVLIKALSKCYEISAQWLLEDKEAVILREKHFIEMELASYENGYYQLNDEIKIGAENDLFVESEYSSRPIWIGHVNTLEEFKILMKVFNR